MQGGPAGCVLDVHVGVRELGEHFRVQEVRPLLAGADAADEFGTALVVGCGPVDAAPESAEGGDLGEAVCVLVELLQPLGRVAELDRCDAEFVVEAGVDDVDGELDVCVGDGEWALRKSGCQEAVDKFDFFRPTRDVVHEVFGVDGWRRGGHYAGRGGGGRNAPAKQSQLMLRRTESSCTNLRGGGGGGAFFAGFGLLGSSVWEDMMQEVVD